VTLTISSTHGLRDKARRAYVRIAGFLAELRENAEQLDPLEKWYQHPQRGAATLPARATTSATTAPATRLITAMG
jgi:hypothetical protein